MQTTSKNLKKSLYKIPLLSGFSDEDYQIIIKEMKYEQVPKDQVLFQKGDPGDKLYIVDKGAVKICTYTEKGDEFIYATFGPGDFFGEMALIDGLPRSADAITTMDSSLYILHKSDFDSLLKSHFKLVEAILRALSRRIRDLNEMLVDASFTPIGERLAKRLLKMVEEKGIRPDERGTITISCSQPYIASMLGTTRESVNRNLRALREKGIISTHKTSITIHDINALRQMAGPIGPKQMLL